MLLSSQVDWLSVVSDLQPAEPSTTLELCDNSNSPCMLSGAPYVGTSMSDSLTDKTWETETTRDRFWVMVMGERF